jgi:hypothetical protein
MASETTPKQPTRRGGPPKALAHAVGQATKRTFGVRGFADGAVVRAWPEIVGPNLARDSLPDRIAFPQGQRSKGTLHLIVAPGGLAVELQHLSPLVIERVNAFFGFECVVRLAITQAPLPRKPPPPARAPRRLSADDEKRIAALGGAIRDPDLRESVRNLGRAMLSRPDGG